MILFQPLRMRRVCVRLRELTLGQAIAVCKLPDARHELQTTEFLRAAAADAEAPSPAYVTDPGLWTVQERARLVCHYLAHVLPDGPDFSVGAARMTTYLSFTDDIGVMEVDAGEIAGRRWTVGHLLGFHAELLERSCNTLGEWLLGAMACQVTEHGAKSLAELDDLAQLQELARRSQVIKDLPESAFDELLAAYDAACSGPLRHLLSVDFSDQGIVFKPMDEKEAGVIAPARFLADACIGSAAHFVSGKPGRSGR